MKPRTLSMTCSKPRYYLIIHCHPGWKEDLGNTLKNSAQTHEKEVVSNAFPNLPTPEYVKDCDVIQVAYCNNVDDGPLGDAPTDRGTKGRSDPALNNYTVSLKSLIAACPDDSVMYLAIFGHSGWLQSGALLISAVFFHPTSQPWANFSVTDTPILLPQKFMSGSQVRIFGCYAGHGPNPIAEQIAVQLPNADVYAYDWVGGSIATNDREIGHGRKNVPRVPPAPKNGDTWFVTFSAGKKSLFRKF